MLILTSERAWCDGLEWIGVQIQPMKWIWNIIEIKCGQINRLEGVAIEIDGLELCKAFNLTRDAGQIVEFKI